MNFNYDLNEINKNCIMVLGYGNSDDDLYYFE